MVGLPLHPSNVNVPLRSLQTQFEALSPHCILSWDTMYRMATLVFVSQPSSKHLRLLAEAKAYSLTCTLDMHSTAEPLDTMIP
jgi:hypothetical protein